MTENEFLLIELGIILNKGEDVNMAQNTNNTRYGKTSSGRSKEEFGSQ